ncbi:amidase [Paracraurococcus lichenis]|uniref:Amidase n=1 Tax=Paracraurococcus lichenis TaxID=3064888 RepID=A0ABT9DZP1_9PROT|nr:amidase [Paracraurococcus sp. LOR1-02]MDO9709215.1 amidase [Paracraurococcus sp. LOR1-02]
MQHIADAAAALATGRISAASLVDAALDRIADPGGEGARAFTTVHAEAARAQARAMDALRHAGRAPSPWAGIPVTIKDLFDEHGHPTPAGSAALKDAPPAAADAPVVARLKRLGFVVIGRTNMTEFAFSGLGINPHYGTPRSPWDRRTGRIPGGSSSGAAVAAADHMGFGGLGTDTGGSCRVPAAMCGVVGYKPTARRVPIKGVLPLSPSLDSVGPLARSVACCHLLDAVISGEENPAPLAPRGVAGLRLGLPRGTFLTEDMDDTVAGAFQGALARLSAAGARIELFDIPELAELPVVNATGGFAASEAWAWHRGLIAAKGGQYDPRILARIRRGERMSAADYIDLAQHRARLIAAIAARTGAYDAVVTPTCPIIPPAIPALEPEAEYNRVNLLLLRNTAVGNFLDRCSISLPIHRPGEAPVGLMLTGEAMADAALFATAAAVEATLAPQ